MTAHDDERGEPQTDNESRAVERALQAAADEALRRHRLLGVAAVVVEGGQTVELAPEQIPHNGHPAANS